MRAGSKRCFSAVVRCNNRVLRGKSYHRPATRALLAKWCLGQRRHLQRVGASSFAERQLSGDHATRENKRRATHCTRWTIRVIEVDARGRLAFKVDGGYGHNRLAPNCPAFTFLLQVDVAGPPIITTDFDTHNPALGRVCSMPDEDGAAASSRILACQQCSKRFTRPENLARHLKTRESHHLHMDIAVCRPSA